MNYTMLPVLLLACMLIIMLMRIAVPISAKTEGKPVKEIGLSFRERILLQRINIYAIGAVLLLTTVTGILPSFWEIIVVCAAIMLLLMRVRYIISNKGVAMNNVVYRPWSDFKGFEVGRRYIRLVPRDGLRPFDLRVLDKHQEEATALVRSYLPYLRETPRAQGGGQT